MPSAPKSSAVPAQGQTESPDSAARDTVPTGALPRSSEPAAASAPTTDSNNPSGASSSSPSSEVRSHPSDAESNTLHSASHPGSSNLPHWDERRVLHLEHEFDQLSARARLLAKRVDELSARLRTATLLGVLALLAAALSWALRS